MDLKALRRSPDVSGQAIAFTALLPVADGREPALRAHLHRLHDAGSPFARVRGTHFGRFVVVPRFAPDPAQRHEDRLSRPFVLLSACLDGPFAPWLADLCADDDVRAALAHCHGAPADQPALAGWLRAHRIRTGVFVAAYPHATVERVRGALELRDRIASLAVRGQDLSPAELQAAFVAEAGR